MNLARSSLLTYFQIKYLRLHLFLTHGLSYDDLYILSLAHSGLHIAEGQTSNLEQWVPLQTVINGFHANKVSFAFQKFARRLSGSPKLAVRSYYHKKNKIAREVSRPTFMINRIYPLHRKHFLSIDRGPVPGPEDFRFYCVNENIRLRTTILGVALLAEYAPLLSNPT